MECKDKIKISVRSLVEFVMQSGDLSSGMPGGPRFTDAVKAHKVVQKAGGEEYASEVPLSCIVEYEGMVLEVGGRADGIITSEEGVVIDEIKTTAGDIEDIEEGGLEIHLAQVKCYAYIYCTQNNLDSIGVQLTYYQLDTEELRRFAYHFTSEELESFFKYLTQSYLEWAGMIRDWVSVRDDSIRQLDFPFGTYRRGQKEFAVAAYKTIKEGSKLFAQAPTGIGKTISALFPAVKALGEGLTSKMFYLTARTTTR
jgi:DNA excision repair protein ERCC-2